MFRIELVKVYLRFSRFIICLELFYYVGHIIMFSIELVNMYVFQIFKVNFILSVISLFWPHYYVPLLQLQLVVRSRNCGSIHPLLHMPSWQSA
jgi:ABC-type uncharacterized transport system permease subunit